MTQFFQAHILGSTQYFLSLLESFILRIYYHVLTHITLATFLFSRVYNLLLLFGWSEGKEKTIDSVPKNIKFVAKVSLLVLLL